MKYTDIITFWFEELTPKDWFGGGEALDQKITERFLEVHTAAAANELWAWREHVDGALAEIIVLDQFSRNIYRGKREAFATDHQALALAQAAIAKGFDQELPDEKKQFLYMPFMHSESKVIQEESVRLFTALGNEENMKYAIIHKDIIDQFGRYPHRNEQLGRATTPEEQTYLSTSEESFFTS